MSQNKSIEETTLVYYEWICVSNEYHMSENWVMYVEGGSYWFYQDWHPGINFLQAVDDNDLPIQKRVRV